MIYLLPIILIGAVCFYVAKVWDEWEESKEDEKR